MAVAQSENIKRIAKNTLLLYIRMLFGMLVSLYTSRVILNTLGVEDYGIYNVVGGVVAMFSIISNSLSVAVSRFLTFELGTGNRNKLQRIFFRFIQHSFRRIPRRMYMGYRNTFQLYCRRKSWSCHILCFRARSPHDCSILGSFYLERIQRKSQNNQSFIDNNVYLIRHRLISYCSIWRKLIKQILLDTNMRVKVLLLRS